MSETPITPESTDPLEPVQPPEGEPTDPPEPEPFDAERAQAKIRKANSEAEGLRKRLREMEPLAKRAQELEDAQKSAEQRAAERADAAEQRAAAFQDRAVQAEVRALAAATFADPDDATGALTLADYVDADGDIDTERISADLAEVLKRKPHWARPESDAGPRRPAPDRTQGSSGNNARTTSTPSGEFADWMARALRRGQ